MFLAAPLVIGFILTEKKSKVCICKKRQESIITTWAIWKRGVKPIRGTARNLIPVEGGTIYSKILIKVQKETFPSFQSPNFLKPWSHDWRLRKERYVFLLCTPLQPGELKWQSIFFDVIWRYWTQLSYAWANAFRLPASFLFLLYPLESSKTQKRKSKSEHDGQETKAVNRSLSPQFYVSCFACKIRVHLNGKYRQMLSYYATIFYYDVLGTWKFYLSLPTVLQVPC